MKLRQSNGVACELVHVADRNFGLFRIQPLVQSRHEQRKSDIRPWHAPESRTHAVATRLDKIFWPINIVCV
jgi:hypothetical protein